MQGIVKKNSEIAVVREKTPASEYLDQWWNAQYAQATLITPSQSSANKKLKKLSEIQVNQFVDLNALVL